jgi:hypothetical protein
VWANPGSKGLCQWQAGERGGKLRLRSAYSFSFSVSAYNKPKFIFVDTENTKLSTGHRWWGTTANAPSRIFPNEYPLMVLGRRKNFY